MVDLNGLRVFVEVAEARSLSAAAHLLGMPPSTVARRVAGLERQLGVPLLRRCARFLQLTDVGVEVLDHARRGRDVADAVAAIVAGRLDAVVGLLRLSSTPCVAASIVAPLIIEFQRIHPAVTFDVDVTDREVDLVADGVDLAFRPRSYRDSSLVALKILAYRNVLVATPAYIASRPRIRHPDDLREHRLLSFPSQASERTWIFEKAAQRDERALTFAPHVATNDLAGLAPLLLDAAGVGVLPTVFRPDLLRAGRLVEVMPEWSLRSEDLVLVHLGGSLMSGVVRAFKEFAVAEAPKLLLDAPA